MKLVVILILILVLALTIVLVLASILISSEPKFQMEKISLISPDSVYILSGEIKEMKFFANNEEKGKVLFKCPCLKSDGVVSLSGMNIISSKLKKNGILLFENTIFSIDGILLNISNYNNTEFIGMDRISSGNDEILNVDVEVKSLKKVEVIT